MFIDYGFDFYAPQTFLDENNKRTILGWMRIKEVLEGKNGLVYSQCLVIFLIKKVMYIEMYIHLLRIHLCIKQKQSTLMNLSNENNIRRQ